MKSLIDGDIITYRIAWTTENEDEPIVRYRVEELVSRILEEVGADRFQIFLSDSTENGFRIKYYDAYKANRTKPKPRHYDYIKEYLITEWKAEITPEQEADDAMGIEQYNSRDETIICTIDKDLNQIPGLHYNFVTKKISYIHTGEGLRFFYQQMLTGDSGENIPGIWKVGPVKANKILMVCPDYGNDLESLNTIWFDEVYCAYYTAYAIQLELDGGLNDDQGEDLKKELLVRGICLKIRQQEGEIWTFPKDTYTPPQLQGSQQLSIIGKPAVVTQSTEPTKDPMDG